MVHKFRKTSIIGTLLEQIYGSEVVGMYNIALEYDSGIGEHVLSDQMLHDLQVINIGKKDRPTHK